METETGEMKMTLRVTAHFVVSVPSGETGMFDEALIAALPPDVKVISASINDVFPAPVAGDFNVNANVVGDMEAKDLGSLLEGVIKALPDDAVVQSGSLSFGPVPAAPAA